MGELHRILILGATGRTGKMLLKLALERGYEVNVLVRDLNNFKVKHERLRIIEGNPSDKRILNETMRDCQVVISTLNISRKSDFPWSRLRTPENFLSETISHVIELCPLHDISRIIVLSAWGVGDSREHIPTWFRWLIEHSNIGAAYREHAAQEQLLAASGLQYTAVRPAALVNATRPTDVLVSFNNSPKPGLTISRFNVARFVLDILAENTHLRKTPVIST